MKQAGRTRSPRLARRGGTSRTNVSSAFARSCWQESPSSTPFVLAADGHPGRRQYCPCPQMLRKNGRWCDGGAWDTAQTGRFADCFGEVYLRDARVVGRANWARQAPISGIIFGGAEQHHMLTLSLAQFTAQFEA